MAFFSPTVNLPTTFGHLLRPIFCLFFLIVFHQFWMSSIIFCGAELRQENTKNNLGGIFEDKARIEVLRKVLRQSGFTTDEEIEEAIIALGPPPKKQLIGGGQFGSGEEFELMEEKQENLAEEEHKAQLHRRTKRRGETNWNEIKNETSAIESTILTQNQNEALAMAQNVEEEEEWKRVNFTLPKENIEDDKVPEGKIFSDIIVKLSRFFHISP